MRLYLISDNVDTQMGMRLAGIEGVVVHEPAEVKKTLLAAMDNKEIAVILDGEACPPLSGACLRSEAQPQITAYC